LARRKAFLSNLDEVPISHKLIRLKGYQQDLDHLGYAKDIESIKTRAMLRKQAQGEMEGVKLDATINRGEGFMDMDITEEELRAEVTQRKQDREEQGK